METMTLEQVYELYPEAHIEVTDRVDSEGVTHPAIYVWPDVATSEGDDGARCMAMYWGLGGGGQ